LHADALDGASEVVDGATLSASLRARKPDLPALSLSKGAGRTVAQSTRWLDKLTIGLVFGSQDL
jgi:hypothetical protein